MSDQPSPRQGGAPKGNRNALKHGFYARHFTRRDNSDLDQTTTFSLQDEINLLRVTLNRLNEHSQDLSTFDDLIEYVRVLSLASSALTRLIRAQALVASPQDELRQAISDAFSQAAAGMGIPPGKF